MGHSLIESPQGDTSSKRVAGLVLVVLGIGAGLVGAWRQNPLLVEFAKYVIGLGSSLLAVGVVEHLVK